MNLFIRKLQCCWYILRGYGVMYRMSIETPQLTMLQKKALIYENEIEIMEPKS